MITKAAVRLLLGSHVQAQKEMEMNVSTEGGPVH